MIVLKCIEISNQYVVYQEVTSVVCQLYAKNIQTNSHKKRSDLWLPEVGNEREGELDEGSQKVQTSSHKNKKEMDINLKL